MDSKKLQRAMTNIKRRLSVYFGYAFNALMKTLYHGGIPLSIIYGKYYFCDYDFNHFF
jgi:hypothetical protein